MFKPVGAIAIASVLILLCGCGGKAPTINESMTKVVQPQAEIIWNVTSRAFNAKGDGLDGSKITAADWAALADAGDKVVKSSATHDAALLYSVSANLDEVCDGCHQPFWGTDEPPPFPNKH